jgi:hypothetical protein
MTRLPLPVAVALVLAACPSAPDEAGSEATGASTETGAPEDLPYPAQGVCATPGYRDAYFKDSGVECMDGYSLVCYTGLHELDHTLAACCILMGPDPDLFDCVIIPSDEECPIPVDPVCEFVGE